MNNDQIPDDDETLGEDEPIEIEEHKPEEIKKAHDQYLNQSQTQQPPNETKILQHREASMEAVLDLAELEQVQREAERLKGLGNKHMANHEYTRACNAYSAALQLAPVGPSSHVFLSNRSAALLSLKQYNAAALDAKRAIAMQPDYGKAYARLGQALYFSKDYSGAIEAYDEAVKLDPDNAVTWAYLAKARGKYAKYKHKLSKDPNNSDTLNTTADSSGTDATIPPPTLEQCPIDEANELRGPDRDEASRLFLRGNHFNERREFQKAIDEYSAALFLCPDDPDISYHLYLGRALAHNQLEMHDAASSDARMAVGLQSNSAEAYSTLGKSLFYLKDYRGAAIALEESLRLGLPNSTAANIDSAYLNKAYSELHTSETTSPSRKAIPKLPPPRFVPREEAISHTPSLPPMPTNWPQQSPKQSQFRVGPERVVTFGPGPMGIKLNRGPDGMIRVLSIHAKTEEPPSNRKGIIQVGDVVREAAGVDLRRPVTNIMWGDTVALIKLAPRPIDLIVAKELSQPPKSVLEELEISRKEEEEMLLLKQTKSNEVDLPAVDLGEEKDEDSYHQPSNASGEEAVRMEELVEECDDLEVPEQEVQTFIDDDLEEEVTAPIEEKDDKFIPDELAKDPTPPDSPQEVETTDINKEEPDIKIEDETKDIEKLTKTILFPTNNLPNMTKEQWAKTEPTRQVIHASPILLQKSNTKFFWFNNNEIQYETRTLVLYGNPSLIVILRDVGYVQELKNYLMIDEYRSCKKEDYYIIESVIDPKMCKLRLSLLTSNTSHTKYEKKDTKKDTCFELITPNQIYTFSLLFNDNDDTNDTSQVYKTTLEWEIHFTISLLSSQPDHDMLWKHQIILGTLHSYVILGDYDLLNLALDFLQENVEDASSIIDGVDDNEYTPLHYACIYRSHRAVHLLTNHHANCTIPTASGSTCLHLSAEKLDDKSLSTLLNGNIDPNVLDEKGRSAMYVAIVDGRAVGEKLDSEGLNRCLAALDVWGGDISTDGLIHPICLVAREWRFNDLAVVLSRCCPHTNPIFPLPKDYKDGRFITSIGYYYDYPIHFALISFYEYILQFKSQIIIKEEEQQSIEQQEISFGELSDKLLYTQYYNLSKTLTTLLEYGFEPNERCYSTSKNIQDDETLMLFYGFTPLQILAVIATHIHAIQEDDLEMKELLYKIVQEVGKVLVLYGGRIALDAPPCLKNKRQSSNGSMESDHEKNESSIDRSILKLDENASLLALLGGVEYLQSARTQYESIKTLANPGSTAIKLQKDPNPIGSEKQCAICWKTFGKMFNRKHTCRASGRYICEECSVKRILVHKDDYRISDGVYNLARKEKSLKAKRDVEAQLRKKEARQTRINQLKEERFGISSATTTKKYEENVSKEDQDRNSLFGNISKQVQNMFMEEDEENPMERQKGNLSDLANTVAQTRDAFLERGEKLNTLSDKTDALREASIGFADMARELNEQQKKGFFW